ncbi:formimidoylglutamase [Micrococcaceae sp. AOP34-BR2-30]
MTRTEPTSWTGRDDGAGAQHRRWHNTLQSVPNRPVPPGVVLVGFASDEGVSRNQGRRGAAAGPESLRKALSSLAVHHEIPLYDHGDVVVDGEDLESGQQEFGDAIAQALAAGHFTVGLGGGHEIAYASYLGVAEILSRRPERRLGVLNLDAHFDLRGEERPTSGTGFAQMADAEMAEKGRFDYAVVGISEAANTRMLFDRARELDVRYRFDHECRPSDVEATLNFVTEFLNAADDIYLTVDLDVLPAAVAPGVSAPAGRGVSLDVISEVLHLVAASGKLLHLDVAELNPTYDIDDRTARTAARLIHDVVSVIGEQR